MITMAEQLSAAATEAGFSQTDMATWLGYEYRTVQKWMAGDRANPLPYKQKHIAERLKLLKRVLKHTKAGLPVPPSVTQFERKAYIEGVLHNALKGIFRAGASN